MNQYTIYYSDFGQAVPMIFDSKEEAERVAALLQDATPRPLEVLPVVGDTNPNP